MPKPDHGEGITTSGTMGYVAAPKGWSNQPKEVLTTPKTKKASKKKTTKPKEKKK